MKQRQGTKSFFPYQPTSLNKSRWWFQTFFIFTPTWGNDPIWLIFCKRVETTNQKWFVTFWLPNGKFLMTRKKPWENSGNLAGKAERNSEASQSLKPVGDYMMVGKHIVKQFVDIQANTSWGLVVLRYILVVQSYHLSLGVWMSRDYDLCREKFIWCWHSNGAN